MEMQQIIINIFNFIIVLLGLRFFYFIGSLWGINLIKEHKKDGHTVIDLICFGFKIKQLKAAGFTVKNFKDAGVSSYHLKKAGFIIEELKDAGYTIEELKEAGFNI